MKANSKSLYHYPIFIKMNKEFTRVRTITDLTISFIISISGILLVIFPTSVSVNILGFFMIITGIILLAVLKTGWRDTETKEQYHRKVKFFSKDIKDEIMDNLENHIENIDIPKNNIGTGLKMEVYYNRRQAFVNLYEYIPYSYEPVSSTFEYSADKIEKLIS